MLNELKQLVQHMQWADASVWGVGATAVGATQVVSE